MLWETIKAMRKSKCFLFYLGSNNVNIHFHISTMLPWGIFISLSLWLEPVSKKYIFYELRVYVDMRWDNRLSVSNSSVCVSPYLPCWQGLHTITRTSSETFCCRLRVRIMMNLDWILRIHCSLTTTYVSRYVYTYYKHNCIVRMSIYFWLYYIM